MGGVGECKGKTKNKPPKKKKRDTISLLDLSLLSALLVTLGLSGQKHNKGLVYMLVFAPAVALGESFSERVAGELTFCLFG